MVEYNHREDIDRIVHTFKTKNDVSLNVRRATEKGQEYIEIPSSDPYEKALIKGTSKDIMALVRLLRKMEI